MLKILVVDDIDVNRKLLQKMLGFIGGFEVIEANNGLQAIEIYKDEQPDLVLMDINMPEMNGYQAAKIIKESAQDSYTPIIFITALSEETSLIEALDSGGDDFISKPLEVAVLDSKIKAHLRIRELNEDLRGKNEQLSEINHQFNREKKLIKSFFDNALNNSKYNKNLVKYYMSPMSTFNGDLILMEENDTGDTFIFIGDAIGHGLSAAMVTLPVAILFYNLVKKSKALSEIVFELNSHLNKVIPLGMFLSATIVQVSKSQEQLYLWSGGLPEGYLISADGKLKDLIESNHLPLGILKEEDFVDSIDIKKVADGDKLYFYSDGIIEAMNDEQHMFGDDRFKACLLKYSQNRFEQTLHEFNNFVNNNEQNDDITLLEISCNHNKQL